ncbi:MAG: hypothetical protein M3362_15975 [Acidobacteriota bacterium]|nr:hypothetical protein [Acidobacteriota bacterium]
MKRCPACQKTYPDEQNFCLEDGTTLVGVTPGSYDSSGAPTMNYPYGSNAPPTEVMQGTPTSGVGPQGYTAPPPSYQPQPYMPPQPYVQQKRSPVLWIVLGVIVLGGIIIGVVLLMNRSSSRTTTSSGGTTNTSSSPSTSSSTTTSSSSWQTVNGDGFTFSMPSQPSHDEQNMPSAVGPIPLHLYTLTKGFEGYIMGYSIYPDSVFSAASSEQLLNGAQNGAVNNVQGQVTSQRSISINGNPGREIIGTSPSKNIGFTARVYIVKPRMYMLVYTQYDKDKPMSGDGRKFLESFQLK